MGEEYRMPSFLNRSRYEFIEGGGDPLEDLPLAFVEHQ